MYIFRLVGIFIDTIRIVESHNGVNEISRYSKKLSTSVGISSRATVFSKNNGGNKYSYRETVCAFFDTPWIIIVHGPGEKTRKPLKNFNIDYGDRSFLKNCKINGEHPGEPVDVPEISRLRLNSYNVLPLRKKLIITTRGGKPSFFTFFANGGPARDDAPRERWEIIHQSFHSHR